jgi:hypothetical protein
MVQAGSGVVWIAADYEGLFLRDNGVWSSLRTSIAETNCLAQALKRATENYSIPRSMALNFVVAGDARETHPIVCDEI